MKIINILPLFVVLLIFTTAANAQIEKGSKMIGGYGYMQLHDPFYFRATPNMGVFVTNRLAIGGSMNLEFQGGERYSRVAADLTPFARYYFGRGSNRLFALVAAGYGGTWEIYSANEGANARREFYRRFSGDLGVGYTRLISDQVGLEAILNFSGINVGFQIYLPKK